MSLQARAERALELLPGHVAARLVRAVAKQQNGRVREAEEELMAVLQSHPQHGQAGKGVAVVGVVVGVVVVVVVYCFTIPTYYCYDYVLYYALRAVFEARLQLAYCQLLSSNYSRAATILESLLASKVPLPRSQSARHSWEHVKWSSEALTITYNHIISTIVIACY